MKGCHEKQPSFHVALTCDLASLVNCRTFASYASSMFHGGQKGHTITNALYKLTVPAS